MSQSDYMSISQEKMGVVSSQLCHVIQKEKTVNTVCPFALRENSTLSCLSGGIARRGSSKLSWKKNHSGSPCWSRFCPKYNLFWESTFYYYPRQIGTLSSGWVRITGQTDSINSRVKLKQAPADVGLTFTRVIL